MFTVVTAFLNLQVGDSFRIIQSSELYMTVEFTNVYKQPGELLSPITRKRTDGTQPLKLWLSRDYVSKYAREGVQ